MVELGVDPQVKVTGDEEKEEEETVDEASLPVTEDDPDSGNGMFDWEQDPAEPESA